MQNHYRILAILCKCCIIVKEINIGPVEAGRSLIDDCL